LRAGRRFYGDPSLYDPPEHIGRPVATDRR
jgi:hypothetical protein